MVEKKSLLEFLNEVAKEQKFEKGFIYAANFANVADMDPIIKEAGKRYVKQYLEEAYNSIDSDKVFTKRGVDWHELFQSITNTEIDI